MSKKHLLPALVALNLPLVLCHPGWPIVDWPPLRALAVGLVMFLIPGLPWVGVLLARKWLDGFSWLWTVVLSLAALSGVVLCVRSTGGPLTGSMAWNGVWLLTNLGIVLCAVLKFPPSMDFRPRYRSTWLAAALFLGAFGLFFFGATRVVPPMEDQDFDVLGCGYGVLLRSEPLLVSDHGTIYQFAHPPMAYYCAAASFLYYDRLDYLAYYDAASQRARHARLGEQFEPFGGTVGGLSRGTGEHRVVGVDGLDYLVDPPLVDGSRRIPVWKLENAVLAQYYGRDPQRLIVRAPNIFLAALTVALLGSWIVRIAGFWPLALLTAIAYATSPEVFVRSSYGGHFASSNFAVLLALLAVERLPDRSRRDAWPSCLLAGGLLALVNHKLVLLPAAVAVWELLWGEGNRIGRRLVRALSHPLVVGFAAGTALFWMWGLSIDAAEFFRDHLQTHYLDRLTHHNPLGYGDYPSVAGLWKELWQHTGYVLLPLAAVTLILASLKDTTASATASSPEAEEGFVRLWLIWTLLAAVVFSLVDWRQTKHLMPLMLVFHLVPARWAGNRRRAVLLVAAAFALLAAWNVWTLSTLVYDFHSFPITPDW